MNSFDAAQHYKENAIKTADGARLILMLYEKAIENLETASLTIKEQGFRGYDQVNEKITKTQEIITELAAALDKKVAPKLCEELLSLYLFFNKELSDANFKKDSQKIDNVKVMLDDLLSSWRKVVDSPKERNMPKGQGKLNVSG